MGGTCSSPARIKSVYFDAFEKNLPSMEGKVVLITGCTTGTGSERSSAAYKKVLEAAPGAKVTAIDCDLMDFSSVRSAIEAVKEQFAGGVDVLCNNAGIMADEDKATKDGYDTQMQTNHLSHFLLMKELMPLLKAAAAKNGEARVVNHTSGARAVPGTPLDPKYLGKNGGNLGGNGRSIFFGGGRWQRYHQTKLANVVFTMALHDRLQAAKLKVKAVCAAPGLAQTSLQDNTAKTGGYGGGWLFAQMTQSCEDGTMPLLLCVAGKDVQSGDFYEPKGLGRVMGLPAKFKLEPICTDPKSKAMLWEESGKAVGNFEL